MLASQPPLERNASEWLVGSPTFQALNVYDPHDFGERFSARGSQREMKPPVCRDLAGVWQVFWNTLPTIPLMESVTYLRFGRFGRFFQDGRGLRRIIHGLLPHPGVAHAGNHPNAFRDPAFQASGEPLAGTSNEATV
jgi:hypothetical protein